MKSYRWFLIQYDWGPYNKRRSSHRYAYTQGKPSEGKGRRQSSTSQRQRLQKKATLLALDPGCLVSETGRKKCLLFNMPTALSPQLHSPSLWCFVLAAMEMNTMPKGFAYRRMPCFWIISKHFLNTWAMQHLRNMVNDWDSWLGNSSWIKIIIEIQGKGLK